MNLLEFAVQRKLEHEDQLLDYVAKHKAVPVDVLSTALADIIGPLEDRRASLLVKNCTEMLSEYVPMTYKRDAQTGTYTVGGEIDEVILDSISLVHDIDAESAVSDMIEANIRVLTNTQAEVHGLNMGELERVATQLNTQTIQTMSDDEAFDVGRSEEFAFEEVVQKAPTVEDVAEETLQEVPESTVEDVVEAVVEDVVEETPEPTVEDTVEDVVEEVIQDAVEDVVEEAPEPTIEESAVEGVSDLDDALDAVPDEPIEDEPAPDEPIEDEQVVAPEDEPAPEDEQVVAPEDESEMTEEDEEQIVANKMKRIYIRLVEDIKAAGLDKSLGLAL